MPVVKKQTSSVKKPQPAPPKKPTAPIVKPAQPATPAPKQPVKPAPTGTQVQGGQAGTAKPKPQAAPVPAAKLPLPKAAPVKPAKPQLASGKPTLKPVSLRYEQELMNNSMLKKIDRKMKEPPDLFGAVLRASDSPEKAFDKMFAMWGKDEEMDAKALASFKKHSLGSQFLVFGGNTGLSCPSGWVENPAYPGQCYFHGPAGGYDLVLSPEQAQAYIQSVRSPRDLFMPPAALLNNEWLTNMSDRALAALNYSQVYVEENWSKDFSWVHPYYNRADDPMGGAYNLADGDITLNETRFIPGDFATSALQGFGWISLAFNALQSSREGGAVNTGIGFGLGNQPFAQAWEAAKWYIAYAGQNPGATSPSELPTNVLNYINWGPSLLPFVRRTAESELIVELGDGGFSPMSPFFNGATQSQFWNTMRFVHAGAVQREGLYSYKGHVDYSSSHLPGDLEGRPVYDVSVFSIVATVYSGDIQTAHWITNPAAVDRNKAIWAVERLGEDHPENFRIVEGEGLEEAPLVTAYDVARSPEQLISGEFVAGQDYDFLPYSSEDARLLIETLVVETKTSQDAQHILFETDGYNEQYAPLLLEAYTFSYGQENLDSLLASAVRPEPDRGQ